MILKKFLNELNKLCYDIDNEYNINLGGCCYLAYLISYNFDKYHINYKLMIGEEDVIKDINKINKEIKLMIPCKTECGSVIGKYTCSHYFLRVNGFDINRCDYNIFYPINFINHTHIKWIYNNGKWSNDYNIIYNKIIKNKINKLFAIYEKSFKSRYS